MKKQPAAERLPGFERLSVRSWTELTRHESEILRRIAAFPNGGNLFVTHPLRLLQDVGVEIEDNVRKRIEKLHPEVTGLSDTPYEALKGAGPQAVKVRVRGLFKRMKR